MKRNTINIKPEVYEQLKKYCNKRGIKINWFIENIIIREIKK